MADPLSSGGYPALYEAANGASLDGQRAFLWALRVRLIGLLAGAAGGALLLGGAFHVLGGVIATIGFVAALMSELYTSLARPDRAWYEGRAAAESVKTLAWRYSVRGQSFEGEAESPDIDQRFSARLRDILDDLKDVDLAADSGEQISPAMRRIRASSFAERRETYHGGRVEDQRVWYSDKAKFNRRRKHRWLVASLIAQGLGLVLGVLMTAGFLMVDALGIMAAVAATITGWTQAKQYSNLATAYGITAQELTTIKSEIRHVTDVDWANYVGQAEEAVSREHTLWRASRGMTPRRR